MAGTMNERSFIVKSPNDTDLGGYFETTLLEVLT
jgi:hypothetical protein